MNTGFMFLPKLRLGLKVALKGSRLIASASAVLILMFVTISHSILTATHLRKEDGRRKEKSPRKKERQRGVNGCCFFRGPSK